MTVLDPFTVVVSNEAELRTCVGTGYTYNHIYFDSNIVLSSGITIDPNKTTLVIDGEYNGTIHSFTDMISTGAADTIGIRAASSIQLTFQNMIMYGRNYYGIPYIVGDSLFFNNNNLTVSYINVSYSGPQMSHHPDGLVHYENCDIRIYMSSTTEAQEVGEVNRVELAGRVRISHESTNVSRAVFWFRGDTPTAALTVLADADVEIVSNNCYFMYNRDGVIIPGDTIPVRYAIEPGASLTLRIHHGISLSNLHTVSSFTVGENAAFYYVQTARNSEESTLYLNGPLTVNQGARFYMQADFANAHSLIHFGANTNAITINDPASFVLYSRSGVALYFDSAAATAKPFTISAGQINYWVPATLLTEGGGSLSDIPDHKWAKSDWSVFSVWGSIISTATTVSGSDATEAELGTAFSFLQFQSAHVLSIGNLPIAADQVANDGRDISGQTGPGANLRIEYTIEGSSHTLTGTADEDGLFSISTSLETPPSLPSGTEVTIWSNTPFLITVITAVATGIIQIISAPTLIPYRTRPIITNPVLLPRSDPELMVVIEDTRIVGDSTTWTLMVSIDGPLRTEYDDTLTDALVFRYINESGQEVIETLGENAIAVFEGGPNVLRTEVSWNEEEGILVRLTDPIRPRVEYTANVIWTIEIPDNTPDP